MQVGIQPVFISFKIKLYEDLVSKINKKNDKRFNNRGYSLFFLMGVDSKYVKMTGLQDFY